MAFARGQAQDFGHLGAQMGNRGWSYEEVLPFRRMESYAGDGDDWFRGREGPLRVTNPDPRGDDHRAVGIPHNLIRCEPGRHRDEPGDDRQRPPHGAPRAAISRPDPQPAAHRSQRLDRSPGDRRQPLLECAIWLGGDKREAAVAREVVVSAGTINSPQLLELSGSVSPSGCAASASRCVRHCPASAKTCATTLRRAPAGGSQEGRHLHRQGAAA